MASTSRNSTVVVQNLAQKWKLDICGTKGGSRAVALGPAATNASPPGFPSWVLAGPSGGGGVQESASRDQQQSHHLLTKKAWEMALGPMKQLPMNLFIMYMAGNSISIFPIMMVFMMGWRPIKAILATTGTFKAFEDEMGSVTLQKLVYILGNALGVGLALYKCQTMGLLPTHASDWLDFVEPPLQMEQSLVTFSS